MRWLALPAGVAVISLTLLDLFHTLVVPRAARRRIRLTRIVFVTLWRPWRWIGVRRRSLESRERWLGVIAPAVLFVFLAVWAFLIMLGFALVLWSPLFRSGMSGAGRGDGFATALYFSGTSLFTIGFGD